MRFLPFMLITAALGAASPAFAAPTLTSSTPAEQAEAAKVTQITLNFSEAVDPAASGVEVLMTGMPGMDHHDPMKMGGVKIAFSPDGKAMVATLPRALSEGTYAARWHVANKGAERAQGALTFTTR
jgi:methionine-rich copper-binding protein CopC